MIRHRLLTIALVIASTWIATRTTRGTSLVFHLDQGDPTIVSSPLGQIYNYTGSLSNFTADGIFVDSESYTPTLMDAAGDTMAVGKAPALGGGSFYVAPNSSWSGTVLTLTVNPNQPAGSYGSGNPSIDALVYFHTHDPTVGRGDSTGMYPYYAEVSAVPEPASLSLFAAAGATMLLRRQRSPYGLTR